MEMGGIGQEKIDCFSKLNRLIGKAHIKKIVCMSRQCHGLIRYHLFVKMPRMAVCSGQKIPH